MRRAIARAVGGRVSAGAGRDIIVVRGAIDRVRKVFVWQQLWEQINISLHNNPVNHFI